MSIRIVATAAAAAIAGVGAVGYGAYRMAKKTRAFNDYKQEASRADYVVSDKDMCFGCDSMCVGEPENDGSIIVTLNHFSTEDEVPKNSLCVYGRTMAVRTSGETTIITIKGDKEITVTETEFGTEIQ